MSVLDLDKFVPEESLIIINGVTYDLTILPSEFGFMLQDLMPALVEMENTGKLSSEDQEKLKKVIYDILVFKGATMTFEELKDYFTYFRLVKFLPRLANVIFGASKKNEVEDEPDTST